MEGEIIMALHENLKKWLSLFTDTIPKESAIAQFEVCQNLLDDEQEKTKDLQQELAKLKSDANFMRYVIHEKGLRDWADEPKKRMEKILYDENDKLILN